MDKKTKTLNLIIEQGMLPQYTHADAVVSVQIMKALYHAGLRAIEYTNRGATAISNFLAMRNVAEKELPGLQLGVGAIRNKIEATEYINEGASFIVCPSVVPAVADLAEINNLLWVPGCMSATEITVADDLGAQIIKLFPAHLLGPSYLKSMKELFPELMFMPAGGVESNEGNLDSWFRSGASVVELGSKLISKNLVETKDYSLIESLTKQTITMVKKLQYKNSL